MMENLDALIREKQAKDYLIYSLRELKIQMKYLTQETINQVMSDVLEKEDMDIISNAIEELSTPQ